MDVSAKAIAARLSRGQQSTIRYMDANPAILGCAEATAIRLSRPNGNRPALTIESEPTGDYEGYRAFALNEMGLAVQALLPAKPD